MSLVSQLAYVGAGATDLDAWRGYVTDVLGHELMPESGSSALYVRSDDRHHRLLVTPADADDIAFVGWDVVSQASLDRAAAAVEAAGVEVIEGSPGEADLRRVLGFAYFTCPHSGVRMELAYGHEAMFTPAFRPSRAIQGFRTGELGLGHVVLYAPDVQKAVGFYTEVFGFGVSDYTVIPGIGVLAAFMHCNARHHSLAFFGIPGAPRKVQHVMFETLALDDVGSTYDVCLARELTTTSLGRHPNDRAFSFYFRTPSGWHMEYAWDPRTIDPERWITEQYVAGRPASYWGHAGLLEMI